MCAEREREREREEEEEEERDSKGDILKDMIIFHEYAYVFTWKGRYVNNIRVRSPFTLA